MSSSKKVKGFKIDVIAGQNSRFPLTLHVGLTTVQRYRAESAGCE